MIISCPECTTKFSIADAVLGDRGRKVRCFKCGHTWHQMPEAPSMAPPPLAVEPMEAVTRRPIQPLMPPTPSFGASSGDSFGMPLESEPAPGVNRAPPVAPPKSALPMDSDEGHRPKPEDDFDIPDIPPPNDLEALAGSRSADDSGSLNTVDVDALLGSSAEDIPKVFAKRMLTEEKSGGTGRWIFLLLVLIGLGSGLWFGRFQIVERFPVTAKFYKMLGVPIEVLGDGLEFRGVTSEMIKEGRVSVLVVRGVIANVVTEARLVPLLRLVLLDSNGGTIQEAFAKPRKDSLDGGAQVGFQIRMEDPSAAAVRYEVTFAEAPAQDSAAEVPATPPPAEPQAAKPE